MIYMNLRFIRHFKEILLLDMHVIHLVCKEIGDGYFYFALGFSLSLSLSVFFFFFGGGVSM
jgi:hypothetical protein